MSRVKSVYDFNQNLNFVQEMHFLQCSNKRLRKNRLLDWILEKPSNLGAIASKISSFIIDRDDFVSLISICKTWHNCLVYERPRETKRVYLGKRLRGFIRHFSRGCFRLSLFAVGSSVGDRGRQFWRAFANVKLAAGEYRVSSESRVALRESIFAVSAVNKSDKTPNNELGKMRPERELHSPMIRKGEGITRFEFFFDAGLMNVYYEGPTFDSRCL